MKRPRSRHRFFTPFQLLLSLLLMLGWATAQADTVEDLQVIATQDPEAAITKIERQLSEGDQSPVEDARLRSVLAGAHLQLGNFVAAANAVRPALEQGDILPPALRAELLGMAAALPWQKGELTTALQLVLQAYRLVEQGEDSAITARTANRLGVLYSNLGRPDEALSYYQTALQLDRQNEAPPDRIASTLGNIGLLYALLEDHAAAAKYQSESVELFETAEDPFGTARNQINLAISRSKLDQAEAALETVNQSLATFRDLGDPRGITSALLARATIQNQRAQPELSLASIDEALPLLEQQQAHVFLIDAHVIRTRALLQLERTAEALEAAQRAVNLAGESGAANSTGNAYNILAAVHEQRGDFAAALEAERAAETARQEQRDARRADLLAVLEVEYATAERERALAELRASNAEQALSLARQQARTRNAWVLIGLSVLGLTGLLLGYRTKTRHARALQTANAHLAALNAEKNALMDIASHDLRSRLASIRWLAQARLHQTGDDLAKPVHQDFSQIAESADHLHHQVSRLLDTQRAESMSPLAPALTLDLSSWLPERIATFQSAAAAKNITIATNVGEALEVRTHIDELASIVDNLIDNALKFSPLGSTVTVNATRPSPDVTRVEVSDQGPGIPEAEHPRLFEKFQKLTPQPTGGENSTGLGLAIVKRLARRLDITVEVHSRENVGTTFALNLPRPPDAV